MKKIITILAVLVASKAMAFQKLNSDHPTFLKGAMSKLNCKVTSFIEKESFNFFRPIFNTFEVIEFDEWNATIIGKTANGASYLLSEDIDEEMRAHEPMRGYAELRSLLNGEALHLELTNDSDQEEVELLLWRIPETSDGISYKGKLVIYNYYVNEYTVNCGEHYY